MAQKLGDKIRSDYFEWLYDMVAGEGVSFRKLFMKLHSTPFKVVRSIKSVKNDNNRISDGLHLRKQFDKEYCDMIDGKCSVLEIMISLAMHCEQAMSDEDYGDRTSQWFWRMMNSLGLNGMYDDVYDEKEANEILKRFLDRDYKPNGEGGLFTLKRHGDVRTAELWYQLQWWMSELTE